jgi:hypothetical protein
MTTGETTGWFASATNLEPEHDRFLTSLRSRAPLWASLGITRQHSEAAFVHPFVGVHLTHVSAPLSWLWISFHTSADRQHLRCAWGDLSYFDDHGPTDGDVMTEQPGGSGVPERLAEIASDWVVTQIQREIERHDWRGWPRATRWVFADTRSTLYDSRGSARLWLRKPQVVTRESAGASSSSTRDQTIR